MKRLFYLLVLIPFFLSSPVFGFAAGDPVATSFTQPATTDNLIGIQLLGSQVDNHALLYIVTTFPTHGTLSGLNSSTGYVTYRSNPGYLGTDSLQYTVTSCNTGAGVGCGSPTVTSPATVTINVNNQRTTINGCFVNPDATPAVGTITWQLVSNATSPGGFIAAKSAVTATLGSDGCYTVSLYPSTGLAPQSYYLLLYSNTGGSQTQQIGTFAIPQVSGVVTQGGLAMYQVSSLSGAGPFVIPPLSALLAFTNALAGSGTFLAADITLGSGLSGSGLTNAVSGSGTTINLAATVVRTDQVNVFGAFKQTFKAGADFDLTDPSTPSKVAEFDLSAISSSTTRTYGLPNRSATFATNTGTLTSGNLEKFDASGNGIDSGIVASTVGITNGSLPSGDVAAFNGSSQIVDAGFLASNIALISQANVFSGGTVSVQTTNSFAFSVTDSGGSNNVFRVDTSTSSLSGGIKITGGTLANGPRLQTAAGVGPVPLSIYSQSAGNLNLGTASGTNDVVISTGGNVALTGVLTAGSGPTTITNSVGKVLAPALDTTGSPQFAALGLGVAATGSGIKQLEAAAPSFAASSDVLYADSTAHRWKMSNNNGAADTVIGAATTDTLSNKTFVAPVLGAANGTSLNLSGALTFNSDTGIYRVAQKVTGCTTTGSTTDGWCVDAGTSRVSSQFDTAGSTTLANITGLTAPVIAGRSYTFKAVLFVTLDATGLSKVSIAGTATATAVSFDGYASRTTAAGTLSLGYTSSLGTAITVLTPTVKTIVIEGTITVNAAGTLTVQFAENVATGTSSVLVGSSFTVHDIGN